MRKHLFLLALMLAFCGGCAGAKRDRIVLKEKIAVPPQGFAKSEPEPYMRAVYEGWHTAKLQVAVRRFLPASRRGPEVWLVAVMHVGEPSYYAALQKTLDERTVVLFEGVNTGSHSRHADGTKAASAPQQPRVAAKGTNSGGYSMQSKMASSLGLVFQLEAIDYDRANFLNSDLSVQKLQQVMAQADKGASGKDSGGGKESLDSLLRIMDGNSLLGSLVKWGMEFIASNPKLQALTKLTLVETIGGLKGDMSDMQAMPADMKNLLKVLIQARNEKAISDLQQEIKLHHKRDDSLAVFYGAGHMDDMEKHLVRDLKYVPVDQTWFDAFAVDVRKSGVTESEAEMTRNMVKWQLKEMRGK